MKNAIIASLAITALLYGAAHAQTFAPPPPSPEIGAAPPPPGPVAGYYLAPGHWQWNGFRYVWVGRAWIPRVAGYTSYVPGQWIVGPYGHWRWVPGHWVP